MWHRWVCVCVYPNGYFFFRTMNSPIMKFMEIIPLYAIRLYLWEGTIYDSQHSIYCFTFHWQ
jgi:hypothetical protein